MVEKKEENTKPTETNNEEKKVNDKKDKTNKKEQQEEELVNYFLKIKIKQSAIHPKLMRVFHLSLKKINN
jgi:hypothetical protein